LRLEGLNIELAPIPGAVPAFRAEVDAAQWTDVCRAVAEQGGRLAALWGSDARGDARGFAAHVALVVRGGLVVLTLPQISLTNHVPIWLTVLVISRDVVIVAVVAIVNLAVGPRTFRPSLLGKAATATFIFANVVIMYFNWRMERSALVDVAIWLALALTLLSAGDYFFRLRRLINVPAP